MSGVLKAMIDAFVGTAATTTVRTPEPTAEVQLSREQPPVYTEADVVRLIGAMPADAQLQLIVDVSRRMPELRQRKIGESRVVVS
jgi:primosomal protein N''